MVKQSQAKPVTMAAVAVIAGAMTIVAACSSSTSTTSSSGSAIPQATSAPAGSGSPIANKTTCKHVNSARMSLESLAHLQMNGSSAGKIRTDLTNIQSQLAKLKGQSHGALASQIGALSASVNQVEKAALGIHSSPSVSQITAVVSALHALKAQSKATIAAMRAACP